MLGESLPGGSGAPTIRYPSTPPLRPLQCPAVHRAATAVDEARAAYWRCKQDAGAWKPLRLPQINCVCRPQLSAIGMLLA